MNPDGISYLDVGDAYWRGDWHNAVNAYWSPLYSWVVGVFIHLFKPTPYWEYPLVHLVNFLILAIVLVCFDFFLATFLAQGNPHQRYPLKQIYELPESYWWLLGYGLFACSSLVLIGIFRVCPDLCVAGLFYLASALIIKIRAGEGRGHYVFLGIVLGMAYLAKAVMFPLGFAFLAVLLPWNTDRRKNLQNAAIAALVFAATAAPFCTAISIQQRRPTFGESGAWNYALYVNGMRYWETDSPRLEHPLRRLLALPPVYQFAQPIAGTYPPWYDPTYWHAGIRPRLAIRASLQNVWRSTKVYSGIVGWMFLTAVVGLCLLGMLGGINPGQAVAGVAEHWAIAVPAVATLALYSPVHAESRFVAAPITVLLLIAYAAVTRSRTRNAVRVAKWVFTCVAIASMLMVVVAPRVHWPVSRLVVAYPQPVPGPEYAEAALALQSWGLKPGDTIGLIWNEKWAHGAVQGAYVPRLLRVRIVAEATDADGFWRLDSEARNRAIQALGSTGIRAILAKDVPAGSQQGWAQLGTTGYFVYWFPAP